MKIAIAADHAGFELKNYIVGQLHKQGHDVKDFGTDKNEPCNYAVYAQAVAEAVASGECERGILLCGTGIGMSIAANKKKGIYAARCTTEEDAELSRRHNDSNVLCMGGRQLEKKKALAMASKWLAGAFEGGRHAERMQAIKSAETEGAI